MGEPFPTDRLDYHLPEALIAAAPAPRRDDSRMLVVDRTSGTLADAGIDRLRDWLRPGDLLVLNDTRVLPARFEMRRQTGGVVRGLFISEIRPGTWEVMLEGSRRLKLEETLEFNRNPARQLTLLEDLPAGRWHAAVNDQRSAVDILDEVGLPPLPPYIMRRRREIGEPDVDDAARYQTVYARHPGAIAAPTAGLHLTQNLLDQLQAAGVRVTNVTLHVGIGTFKPVDVDDLARHDMHAEWYDLRAETCDAIHETRRRGGRVVAVGTTTVRVLESAAADSDGRLLPARGETSIFIYPPYRFRCVDALLTNFHLPRSTLLALIMALAGEELVREAYAHAVRQEYRFYSYGDAMLIV